jgi:TetR/AcrR family transcriptional regulator, cholesterol catabolism regulator
METLVTKKVSIVLHKILKTLELVDRIKEQANLLYKKYGLRSVTMDEIATSLGISKKTIYNYFEDKDALVDAVIIHEIKLNEHQCDVDKANATNAIHEIFLAMEMIQKTFADMNPSLVNDLKKYHAKSYTKFEMFKNDYLYNVIKNNIERGIKEELYRPEVSVDIIATLRLETMMLAFNQDLFQNGKYRLVFIEEQLIMHFLYGIASLKGYKLIMKYQNELSKK